MSQNVSSLRAIGFALAITLSATHAGGAQSTRPDSVRKTRRTPLVVSSERIKISKEVPVAVVAPDTLVPPSPPAVVEAAPPPPPPPPPPPAPAFVARRPPGFFAGLGAGLAFAGEGTQSNDIALGVDCIPGQPGDPNSGRNGVGYSVAVPFGWQPIGSPLGLRFTVGYSATRSSGSWLASDGTSGYYATKPQIWTGDVDAKLKLFTAPRGLAPYVIGGLSVGRYRRLIDATGSDPIDQQDQRWHNAMGYNAGAGLEYMFGRTGVFVESRYVHLSGASGFKSISQVPVMVGLTWY
jgi:opacity protein-like surface antigen